jgi:hypothetical protein
VNPCKTTSGCSNSVFGEFLVSATKSEVDYLWLLRFSKSEGL